MGYVGTGRFTAYSALHDLDGALQTANSSIASANSSIASANSSLAAINTLLASGVKTIFLSCAGGWSSATLPDAGFLSAETSTNKVNFKGTKMAASASDQKHEFGLIMPMNYNGGTVTGKAVFYVPSSTDASSHTVIFGLQGVAIASGGTADTAYGTAQEVTYTVASSIAGKIITTDAIAAMTIAGSPAGGNWHQFRTYRKGSDTYTGDLILLGWILNYTTDNYSDV